MTVPLAVTGVKSFTVALVVICELDTQVMVELAGAVKVILMSLLPVSHDASRKASNPHDWVLDRAKGGALSSTRVVLLKTFWSAALRTSGPLGPSAPVAPCGPV